MKVGIFILILISFSTSNILTQQQARGSSPKLENKNVFGRDDRIHPGYKENPYNWIVKIEGGCSGALVGRNLVLTAAHCIKSFFIKNNQGWKQKYNFHIYTHYDHGSYKNSAVAINAIWGKFSENLNVSPENDWAIITLNKDLGREEGFFGYFTYIDNEDPRLNSINTGGFPGDLENGELLSVHIDCETKGKFPASFSHNCDTTQGASGSPIWIRENNNEYYIVGINYGENRGEGSADSMSGIQFSSRWANFMIRPKIWSKALLELRD